MAVQSPNRVKNTGKSSEAIFEEECSAHGGVVIRLRDKADLVGLNKNKNVAAFGQPSDFIVVAPQGMFFAEVKSSHNKTSFPLDCFTRAQRATMGRCVLARAGKHYRVYIHNVLTDTWYISDATQVVNILKSGVKSIKWANLKPLTIWVF